MAAADVRASTAEVVEQTAFAHARLFKCVSEDRQAAGLKVARGEVAVFAGGLGEGDHLGKS